MTTPRYANELSTPTAEAHVTFTVEDEQWWEALDKSSQRKWDKLANMMTRYHDHFQHQFVTIYQFADHYEKMGMSQDDWLEYAASLSGYLHAHHGIEETYFFPVLADAGVPQFQGHLPDQHKGIHDGLDRYDAYIKTVKKTPTSYSPAKLREILDSFRDVLFSHLDDEILSLRGRNLHKYLDLQQLNQFPM